MQAIKDKIETWRKSPNSNYAMIGIIGALGVLGITFIILGLFGGGEKIDDFAKRWEQAVESKQPQRYRDLWDSAARRQNRAEYDRAENMVKRSGRVDADISYIAPQKDFRNANRNLIDRIPISLYDADDNLVMTVYRDLIVEQKGLSKRWKIIQDVFNGDPDYPDPIEGKIIATSDETTTLTDEDPTIESTTEISHTEPMNSDPIAGNAPIDTKLKLSQVLGDWQDAWQSKDIDRYMDKYADEARITRVTVRSGKESKKDLTKTELREGMERVSKLYSKIEIFISNLEVNGDSAVADVGFLQEFRGTPAEGSRPSYSDYGTKTLIFMIDANDGMWKIYSESWKMYKDVPKYPKL